MRKFVIEVRGGLVVSVHSNENIEFVIVDWDTKDEERVVEKCYPENVTDDIAGLFIGSDEVEVREQLKKLGY